MSTTSTITGCAEWKQFYEQGAFDGVGAASFPDATRVTASLMTSDGNLSPGSSSPVNSKRRRSRASKRAPTTLLNADTSNFRALVHQFTGCPSRPLSQRGPVNLNFAVGNEERIQTNVSSASTMPIFGTNYYFQHPNQPQPPQQQQHHMFQNQQNDVPYHGTNTDIPNGFDAFDAVSVQDFRAYPYSSGHRNDGYFS
ncbi:hypothetical protein SLEP1_g28444 [Rubroshorea leprosula]|uniref:VQ domain-containing protein n=1 Tax=Rubroshorea leprosula TaxID=152421 RepID=A0AAV5K353_9ROSI|nr:hypothetical protein SLEP1_g28444 [Rubroshorea leprosula]